MNHHTQNLIATLKHLPPDWPLVPTKYKKPLGYFWQTRPFVPGQLIQGLIAGGVTVLDKNRQPYYVMPTGIGLLTGHQIQGGSQTYYLMALDQDGISASLKILELSEGTGLPHTIAFTSGRPGRCQYLFVVPAEDTSLLRTRKISTGKDEALELRWKGCQSILPPSLHPTTGQYRWCDGCSITTTPVALAPYWLLALMRSALRSVRLSAHAEVSASLSQDETKATFKRKHKPTKTKPNLGKRSHQERQLRKYLVRKTNSIRH
jgi:hypothetical protein